MVPVCLLLLGEYRSDLLWGRLTVDYKISSERPVDWPAWLEAPPTAFSVYYGKDFYQSASDLRFQVHDPYPANTTVKWITDTLEANEFRPLAFDLMSSASGASANQMRVSMASS